MTYLPLVFRDRAGQIEAGEMIRHRSHAQGEAAQIESGLLEFQCPRHKHSVECQRE
jgi:hypothetical protein